MLRDVVSFLIIASAMLTGCAEAKEHYTHLFPCSKEVPKEEGFPAFLTKLKEAVAKHDVDFIKSITDEKIQISFGDENGKASFIKGWKLDSDPDHSEFWGEISEVLALGKSQPEGAENDIVYPCTFDPLPKTDWIKNLHPEAEDNFATRVVVKLNADLIGKDGKKLRKLAYLETVYVDSYQGPIHTYDGLTGTVDDSAVRMSVDYRAWFSAEKGQWMMTGFIAGD